MKEVAFLLVLVFFFLKSFVRVVVKLSGRCDLLHVILVVILF